MRAVLVDDERLALSHLKQLLERDVGGIEVVGVFSNPAKVVEKTKTLQPDVVFLDIHMPGINGVHLGEQLQEALTDVEIVFVTGYDQFAVQAFELYALDYIMKPARSDRLRQTVQRLQEKRKTKEERSEGTSASLICCFNQIRFQLPGKEPQIVKWRTSKAQELFAFLLHRRDQVIDRSTLMELLWPDFEMPRAAQQLYTTIYHIRQTLKSYGMGTVTISCSNFSGGYKLNIGEARIDTEEWEQLAKQALVPTLHNITEYEHILNLYSGDYLGHYDYLWAEHERERLRMVWLNLARKISRFHLEQQNILAAIQVNLRVQQVLPDVEESYFTLMKLYDLLGDSGKVEEQYWLLSSRMENELGSAVGDEIKTWYERWKQAQS